MTIKRLGVFSKTNVTIDGFDVSGYVTSIKIFGDLFSPSWVCELYITDTVNLTSSIPIKAMSTVELSIQSDSTGEQFDQENLDIEFIVAAITDKKVIRRNFVSYKITAISQYMFDDLSKKDYSIYNNTNPTEIIESRLKKLGISISTSQANSVSWASNGKTLLLGSYDCTKMCVSSNKADFLLFQSGFNKMTLSSVKKMYEANPSLIIYNSVKNDRTVYDETNALAISIFDIDSVSNMMAGVNTNAVTIIDPFSKNVTVKDYEIGADDKIDSIYERSSYMIPSSVNNSTTVIGVSDFETGPGLSNKHNWISSRKSNIARLFNKRISILHFAHLGIIKYLGKPVTLNLTDNAVQSGRPVLDQHYGGKALVSAFRLDITPGKISYMSVEYTKIRPWDAK